MKPFEYYSTFTVSRVATVHQFTNTTWSTDGRIFAVQLGVGPVRYADGSLCTVGRLVLKTMETKTVVDDAGFKAASDAFRAEHARLAAEFRNDLYLELGIHNNPKRDRLYEKAYEMGHSNGWSEVYNMAYELVCLIED